MMKTTVIAAILALAAAIGGCTRQHLITDYQSPEAAYLLDSGDRLRVVVFGQEDLSRTYIVDDSGNVAFPLVGAVHARGRSVRQFESQLAARLGQDYLRNPDVAAEIDRYRPFFIFGEVRNPGQYPYVDGLTVQAAIAAAGGFGDYAGRNSVMMTRTIRGRQIHGRGLMTSLVRPGDVITVKESMF